MSPHFAKNNKDMIDAAARCVELRQFLPALVLIYAHIDTLAWAGSSKEKQSTRRNFESWVTDWLLPELRAEVPSLTATDLYAARCGVLHSLTSKSDLSIAGAAREIAYAWGSAKASVLDEALSTTRFADKLVTLHYDVLLNGLRNAVARFIRAAESNTPLRKRIEDAAGKHYMNIPRQRVDNDG